MDNLYIDEKKEEVKRRLENYLFVDKYDIFKKTIDQLNEFFKLAKIDYQYTYDEFCKELTEEFMKNLTNNPDIDIDDLYQISKLSIEVVSSLIKRKIDN